METELLNLMVVNLPNFTFAGIGMFALYRVIMRQWDHIESHCQCGEDDDEVTD